MRRSDDFRRTMRQGRRVGSPTLVLHRWTDDSSTASPRVGLVVSRAVGSSVTRHTVSRRLRHLMRDRLPMLHPGDHLVVRATPRAATAESSRLVHDLDACLERSDATRVPGGQRW
jgi:ribonuclease P protein component